MATVISVRFKPAGKAYFFDPGALEIQKGEYVIVDTARGTECGEVVAGCHQVPDASVVRPLKTVVRMADSVDVRRMRQNRADEEKAFAICEERIRKHKLEMKLVEVEYLLDRSKILFYFTADGRIDFRELVMKLVEAEYNLDRTKIVFYFTADGRIDFRDLVKDLAGVFHTRIELRQIGVRDESKMLGGLGICGQPFCCSRFLNDFQPVSIKMAKEQGLSLNPTKISGSCGRLMCCLAYEQKAYEYLNRITPQVGSEVKTPDGVGTVTEVNLISGYLKVRLEKGDTIQARYYKRSDCTYIRGGRRAPQPPDPEDE